MAMTETFSVKLKFDYFESAPLMPTASAADGGSLCNHLRREYCLVSAA
jgi:hypothetical protein